LFAAIQKGQETIRQSGSFEKMRSSRRAAARGEVTFGHNSTDIWTALRKKNPVTLPPGLFVLSAKTGSEPGLAFKREKR